MKYFNREIEIYANDYYQGKVIKDPPILNKYTVISSSFSFSDCGREGTKSIQDDDLVRVAHPWLRLAHPQLRLGLD
jgi:hypothetical protein